jgi:hypothetical protein
MVLHLQFNLSIDGGSNYNVTKTTTYFLPYHNEADNSSGLIYSASSDLAQSTAFQSIILRILEMIMTKVVVENFPFI